MLYKHDVYDEYTTAVRGVCVTRLNDKYSYFSTEMFVSNISFRCYSYAQKLFELHQILSFA